MSPQMIVFNVFYRVSADNRSRTYDLRITKTKTTVFIMSQHISHPLQLMIDINKLINSLSHFVPYNLTLYYAI